MEDNKENESNYKIIDYFSIKLKKLTIFNEYIGFIIMVDLLVTIVSFVIGLFMKYEYRYDVLNYLIYITVLFVIEIILIALFQNNCKKGNVFFQEIADVIEKYRNNSSIEVDVRISIKRFLASSELPLIQGKFGSSIYFALSLMMYIIAVIFIYKQ